MTPDLRAEVRAAVTRHIAPVARKADAERRFMRDALTGREVVRTPVGSAAFRKRYRYPYGVIYRPDLHNTLIEACKAQPQVGLSVNQKVTGF